MTFPQVRGVVNITVHIYLEPRQRFSGTVEIMNAGKRIVLRRASKVTISTELSHS